MQQFCKLTNDKVGQHFPPKSARASTESIARHEEIFKEYSRIESKRMGTSFSIFAPDRNSQIDGWSRVRLAIGNHHFYFLFQLWIQSSVGQVGEKGTETETLMNLACEDNSVLYL